MRKLSPWLPILSPPIWSLSAAPTPVPLPRCNHYGRVWRVSHYSRETVWVAPVRDDALAISGDAERWPIWGQREGLGLQNGGEVRWFSRKQCTASLCGVSDLSKRKAGWSNGHPRVYSRSMPTIILTLRKSPIYSSRWKHKESLCMKLVELHRQEAKRRGAGFVE
jgi:hypothetical protein